MAWRVHMGGVIYVNIEKFYYDEQTEMYELMKKEQHEHDRSLSAEEKESADLPDE